MTTPTQEQISAVMAELGRRSHLNPTPAQQEASRKNGKNGGRPKGSKDRKPRRKTQKGE